MIPRHRTGPRGFTMIELLAAMAIISILTSGIVATVTRFMGAFQDTSFQMKATQVADAVVEDYLQNPDPTNAVTNYSYTIKRDTAWDNYLELTGLQLMPGVKLGVDTTMWEKKDTTGQTRLKTSQTYRDLVQRYIAFVKVKNGGKGENGVSNETQPLPLDPSIAATAAPIGYPEPTLFGLSVRVQMYDKHAYSSVSVGGLGLGVTAPLLAEAQTIVLRDPRRWMSRRGTEGFKAITSGSGGTTYRPVTVQEDSADGITATLDGWTYRFDKKVTESAKTGNYANYILMVNTPYQVYSKGPTDGSYTAVREYQYTTAHALGVTVANPSATMPDLASGSLAKQKWRVLVNVGNNNTYSTLTYEPSIPVTKKGYEMILPLYNPDGTIAKITPWYNVAVRICQLDAPPGGTGQIQRVRFVY